MIVMRRLLARASILMALGSVANASEYSEQPRLPDDERETALAATDDVRAGRYDEAAAKYRSMLAKHPDSLYAWSNLGVVCFQQRHLDEAQDAFENALKLQPRDAFTLVNLSFIDSRKNQYDKARVLLERAIQIEPNNAEVHEYLAGVSQQLGRKDEAAREVDAAHKIRTAHFFQSPVDRTLPPRSRPSPIER